MNLRQLDEHLERHTAGWNLFKGDFRISRSSFRRNPLDDLFGRGSLIGEGYRGISDLGNAGAGAVGYETPEVKTDIAEKNKQAAADTAAAIKQAEFEASARAGLERLALKRRKGFAAAMLVDPGSALGSTSTLGS